MPPGLVRFTATTPSLRLGWLLANALVLGLVALPTALWPGASWPPAVLVAAPLVAAAAVAFAYGPTVDPAYEAVAATPLSPVRALLVRLAAVLVANTLLAGAVDLAADQKDGPQRLDPGRPSRAHLIETKLACHNMASRRPAEATGGWELHQRPEVEGGRPEVSR